MNGEVCIYYNNTNGLLSKLKKLKTNENCFKNDIIAFTETNLNSSIHDENILPKDFTIYRKDRANNEYGEFVRGGGVLIAIKNQRNFFPERITHTTNYELFNGLEIVSVKLTVMDRFVYLCCLYIPSGSDLDTYNRYCVAMERLKRTVGQNKLIVMGDFNLPLLEWRKKRGASILQPVRTRTSDKDELVDLFVENEFWHPYRKGDGKYLDIVLTNCDKGKVKLGTPYRRNILVQHEDFHQPLVIVYSDSAAVKTIENRHFTLHVVDENCKVSNRTETGKTKRAKPTVEPYPNYYLPYGMQNDSEKYGFWYNNL